VADVDSVRLRPARLDDAEVIAELHAESWRRHYRGAYADAFLDGDVRADRTAVWKERLGRTTGGDHTVLAEHQGVVVGFAHTIFDKDPTWGALLDNLHVTPTHHRLGIGGRMLRRSAEVLVDSAPGSGLYLWVLEQNRSAQAFYKALGGVCVERGVVPDPGGVPGRLNGSPPCFRYAWRDPAVLRRTGAR
jgi:ribosomal protein S18 acetylase RimI-like enzyme